MPANLEVQVQVAKAALSALQGRANKGGGTFLVRETAVLANCTPQAIVQLVDGGISVLGDTSDARWNFTQPR